MALIEKKIDRPAPSMNDYDEDTQAILKEMSGEGFDVGVEGLNATPAAAAVAPQATATPTVTSPRTAPVAVDDEEKVIDEEDDEEANAPEAGAPGSVEPGASTTPGARSIAEEKKQDYWREKARDTENALKEALEKLSKFEQRDAFAHVDDKINEIAKKYGANAGVIKEILTLGKDAFIPPELKEAMADIAAERQTGRFWDEKFTQFDGEFETSLLPVLLHDNPNITQAEVDKIYAQLGGGDKNGPAWQDENSDTPLVTLYFNLVKSTQTRASSESTRVRSRSGAAPAGSNGNGSKPLNEMQPGEIQNMTDEEFETYSEGLRGSNLQH